MQNTMGYFFTNSQSITDPASRVEIALERMSTESARLNPSAQDISHTRAQTLAHIRPMRNEGKLRWF